MRLPLPQFIAQPRHPEHVAEVIETSSVEFLAQCLEPEDLSFPVMPAFGSWVKSADEESGSQIYAVVCHATTSPIDSIHRARALGLSLSELREQQPQIFAMLKTEFKAAIVGFNTGQSIYQHLPPRPPQIHQAVYCCAAPEILDFTTKFDFLRTLLQIPSVPVDALVAATIREIYQLRQLDHAWLVQAGRSLSLLLKEDYDRLQAILSQIHP
ncbi:Sll1318 protein [uncultured Synechococcales cyanobacterium]|uniref:Sll1318 protein n=1 Tax=uncultured Synechococcales cyanobacterium TaxID=1936017 RepID=A0A6J4VX95_9CYAN|nr:Sll1318 protein [uncultured Synechococcales cyanobacterium]